MRSWVDYWDSDHSIYVSERHKQLHAAAIANDILRQVHTAEAVVLDHGAARRSTRRLLLPVAAA